MSSEIAAPEPIQSEPDLSKQEETNARLAGASAILALGNVLSRIMGLVRDLVISAFFGASGASDAYFVATLVPKAFFDLLIGGHVNGAIVPVLSDIASTSGRKELWRIVSILLSLVATIFIGLVILIEIFAPQIIAITAGGAPADIQELSTSLLRITSPALLFLGLFAVLSGTLFALNTFTWPAFAGVVFNASIVLVTLIFAPPVQIIPAVEQGVNSFPFVIERPPEGIVVVAIGWFVGAIMQVLLQFPGLRGAQIHFTLNWRHPALRKIALLYAPVMITLLMDTLIIRPFSYNIASQTGEGNIAIMNWATTLIQFPQGLVATAISIAILPTLSRQAIILTTEGRKAFKDTLGLGLRLATSLIIPAAVGLFVLATPIIILLFQRGAFDAEATEKTTLALRLYLLGLPFAGIDLLLVYAFYARKDTLTPAIIGVISLIVYMLVTVLLAESFGLYSLMIADSVKHVTHAFLSSIVLNQRIHGFGSQRILLTIGKSSLASLVMGLAGFIILPWLMTWIGTSSFISTSLLVIIAGSICVAIYFMMASLLRIDELRWIFSLLRQRLARS